MLGCGKWRLGYMGLVDDIRYGNERTDIEGGGVCVRLWGLGAGGGYCGFLARIMYGCWSAIFTGTMGLVHV